jgi:hypothetical protein
MTGLLVFGRLLMASQSTLATVTGSAGTIPLSENLTAVWRRRQRIFAVLLCGLLFSGGAHAQALDWPNLYDANRVLQLNVKLRQGDWNRIVADDTFDIEVPALFWESADGHEAAAILVSIRRKSATPINGKVSYKIDINEYEGTDSRAVSRWKSIKKLSLENGDDVDVVSEGLAWFMHRLASDASVGVYPEGHLAGMANWATITFHLAADCAAELCDFFAIGETVSVVGGGIFLNVEQRDKQFLKNRGLWVSDATWLYKQDEPTLPPEVKEAPCDVDCDFSPARTALQCAPFLPQIDKGKNNKLEDCDLEVVDNLVYMPVLLATGAVNAFASNPDELLNHEKNFYSVDYGYSPPDPSDSFYLTPRQRIHFPWDLDSAISNIDRNVYGSLRKRRGQIELIQTEYQRVLLQGDWRTLYNTNLMSLTDVNTVEAVHDFLDEMQYLLTPFLIADPNSKVGNPVSHFNGLRSWVTERAAIVRDQVCADDPDLNNC